MLSPFGIDITILFDSFVAPTSDILDLAVQSPPLMSSEQAGDNILPVTYTLAQIDDPTPTVEA